VILQYFVTCGWWVAFNTVFLIFMPVLIRVNGIANFLVTVTIYNQNGQ
jgi:hypothetical protein